MLNPKSYDGFFIHYSRAELTARPWAGPLRPRTRPIPYQFAALCIYPVGLVLGWGRAANTIQYSGPVRTHRVQYGRQIEYNIIQYNAITLGFSAGGTNKKKRKLTIIVATTGAELRDAIDGKQKSWTRLEGSCT